MKLIKQLLPHGLTQNTLFSSDLTSMPMITLKGRHQFIIENKYTLLFYSANKLKLQYELGTITIIGTRLLIQAMYPEELILQGTLEQVIFSS